MTVVLELLLKPIDSFSPPSVAGASPSSETSRRIDLKCFDMMLQLASSLFIYVASHAMIFRRPHFT